MVMWECVRDLLDQRPEAQSLAFRFMAALARGQLERLGPLEHGCVKLTASLPPPCEPGTLLAGAPGCPEGTD